MGASRPVAFHDLVTGTPDRVLTSFNETTQNREEQHQNMKIQLERLGFMRKRFYALADQKSGEVGDLLQVERELSRAGCPPSFFWWRPHWLC